MQMIHAHDGDTSWHALVEQAKVDSGHSIAQGLDHYLALTLEAHLKDITLASNVLALNYLENINGQTHETLQKMRQVGDQCLLLSGLFPERAQKRNVSLEYYINLGKNAYLDIARAHPQLKLNNELFYELSVHFVGLMDILHFIGKDSPL